MVLLGDDYKNVSRHVICFYSAADAGHTCCLAPMIYVL
jgi:hypothetical protein